MKLRSGERQADGWSDSAENNETSLLLQTTLRWLSVPAVDHCTSLGTAAQLLQR